MPGRSLLVACLAFLAAASARGEVSPDNPRYWNVLFYPKAPHVVHVVYGGADDPAALVQALREEHPYAEIAQGPPNVVDINVLPDEADDIVAYLNNALDRSQEWTNKIQPADFAAISFPENGDAVNAVRTMGLGGFAPGAPVGLDALPTSDYSKAKGMLSVLLHEQTSSRAVLRRKPAIAELIAREVDLLKGLVRFNRVINQRLTLQVRLRGPGEAVEGAPEIIDMDQFARRWRIGPDSLRLADRLPFPRGACFTPVKKIAVMTEDVASLEVKIMALAAQAGAVVDEPCAAPSGLGAASPEGGNIRKFLVVLPTGTATQFQTSLSHLSAPLWVKEIAPSVSADVLERRYQALTREASEPENLLEGFPAVRGLVAAEIGRLAPVVARATKTRGRDAIEINLSRDYIQPPYSSARTTAVGASGTDQRRIPGAPYSPDRPPLSADDAAPDP